MKYIEYAQMGAGGLTWLIFLAGLLWCNFAWWRTSRCKRSLFSMLFASITALGLMAMIGLIAAIETRFISSSTLDSELIESLSLGGFVMMAVCWTLSSIAFFLAVITNVNRAQPRG